MTATPAPRPDVEPGVPEAADAPAWPHPSGADRRRGPLRAGERVQLTDVKGRLHTIMLTTDGYFQSQRGSFRHTELIGRPDDVKKILLGNCTGLGRDPLFQGAGIPNLVKMLLST